MTEIAQMCATDEKTKIFKLIITISNIGAEKVVLTPDDLSLLLPVV